MKEFDSIRQETKTEVSVKQKKQVEHQLIGNIIPHDGHTVWQIDMLTGKIEKAKFSSATYHLGGENKKEVIIKDSLVRAAFGRSLRELISAIHETIEITPPELVGDIYRNGLYLCGGGSLLRGIDELIQKELSVTVHRVEDPLTCVVRGTGVIVENIKKHSNLLYDLTRLKPINA